MNRQVPVLVGAGIILAVFGIPGGNSAEFREAKRGEHELRKLDAAYNLVFNLRRGTGVVSVILREAAYAQQLIMVPERS